MTIYNIPFNRIKNRLSSVYGYSATDTKRVIIYKWLPQTRLFYITIIWLKQTTINRVLTFVYDSSKSRIVKLSPVQLTYLMLKYP